MELIYAVGYQTDERDYGPGDADGIHQGERMATPTSVQALSTLRTNQTIPDQLIFKSRRPGRLARTDFPVMDIPIDVMSQALINTIEQCGDVDWTLVPAQFVDAEGQAINGAFSAVYFERFSEWFDYEQSQYQRRDLSSVPLEYRTEEMLRQVETVDELVVQAPVPGLPPLFRLSAYEMTLYASAACRDAVLAAGHTGIRFDPRGRIRR